MKDVVIIGGGPAGVAAAIYLKRAGLSLLIFEKHKIGGLLLNANLVENYPGFPLGISGPALVELFEKHLCELEVDVEKEQVTNLSFEAGTFRISTDARELDSKAVIIASGTVPKEIEALRENPLFGRKLFYEIKDIPTNQRGVRFVIIGAGDAAFDYALNLAESAKRVDILMRSAKPRCLALLEERARLRDNIFIHPKTEITGIRERKEGIIVGLATPDGQMEIGSDYAFVACGREPNLSFVSNEMKRRLTVNLDGTTNFPGLFVAGDVKSGLNRQTGIAVGDGILCAMKSVDFLAKEKER